MFVKYLLFFNKFHCKEMYHLPKHKLSYRLYSGECWYFTNSACHSAVDIGGKLPINFQSVMDRPDLVRRVTPPIMTILKTQALHPKSQKPTCLCAFTPFVTKCLLLAVSKKVAWCNPIEACETVDARFTGTQLLACNNHRIMRREYSVFLNVISYYIVVFSKIAFF